MAGGRFSVEAVFRLKDRMTRGVRKISSSVERMTKRASRGLARMEKRFAGVNKGIKKTGVVVAGVAAGVGLALKGIISTGADFEQAITNVGAVSLQSRKQIASLEQRALSLGKSTKFTATEVAGAMEIMARSGFKTEEILSGVSGVLDAAAASGLEIAEVADVVSGALKGMGLEASEATNVADILALASSRTNSTIGSLGESLKNVASTARQLKIPLKDVVAGVALLQDVGLDASVAGSAMNTMLTKLAKPPAKLAKQMKAMNVTFKDAKGDMLPFQEVLGNISKAAKKSGGNLDQVAFLADLVGLRGQKAAVNLAKLFETGKLQELTKELGNAAGTAKKMAAIRMDTLKGDLDKLTAAADNVQISLFKLESGPLRGVVAGMTKWIEQNEKLIVSGIEDFFETIRQNGDQIVSTLKNIGIGIGVFFALQAAVKAAQIAIALYNITIGIAKGLQFAYNLVVGAGSTALAVYRIASDKATLSQKLLGFSSLQTAGKIRTLRVALKAGTIIQGLNGITSKMGKAGVLGAVFAVTAGLTTMLLKFTGLDKKLEKFGESLAGPKGGKIGVLAPGVRGFAPLPKGPTVGGEFAAEAAARAAAAEKAAQLNLLPENIREEALARQRAGAQSQVVSPQERVAREVTETTTNQTDTLEVTIKAPPGVAEVTKTPARSGVRVEESGGL